MDTTWLERLTCPYCRSALEIRQRSPLCGESIDHGIVGCACYEYPIVDGILVLRQMSGLSDTDDRAVRHLRAGDIVGARDHLLRTGSMVSDAERARSRVGTIRAVPAAARTLVGRLTGNSVQRRPPLHEGDGSFRAELGRLRPGGFASYLFQRYANPSFVASVPLMSLLSSVAAPRVDGARPVVLDLGCGVGHSTAMMQSLFPMMTYVAAEPDFVNLHLLRRYFVPDAVCVCIDAELPLPFDAGSVDAVFCLDVFHYIRSKWALLRELDRVVSDDGVWMFPHLHNAEAVNPSPGIPLDAVNYLRVFASIEAVMFDEASVLDEFMSDQTFRTTNAPSVARLREAAVFSLVGSRHGNLEPRYDLAGRIDDTAAAASIGVNPIYRMSSHGGTAHLDMDWPDGQLEFESCAIRSYLPDHLEVDAQLIADLDSAVVQPARRGTVEELLRRFVLVHLPPGYRDSKGAHSPRR